MATDDPQIARKAAAGQNGGDAEAAAQMADEANWRRGTIRGSCRTWSRMRPSAKEQRHHGVIEVGHACASSCGRRSSVPVPRWSMIAEAGDADEAHGHADWHAQQHQRQTVQTKPMMATASRRSSRAFSLAPTSRDQAASSVPDGRSADRSARRSAARRRRRRSMRPRRTARPAIADRRSQGWSS